MGYGRDGRNPAAYLGIRAKTPPELVVIKRPPTTTDIHNFVPGTLWVVPTQNTGISQQVWILMSIAQSTAIWVQIYPATAFTALETLTPDSGPPVHSIAQNINLVGGHDINTSSVGDGAITINVDNAITLGDVTNIAAGDPALSISTGDIAILATNGVGNIDLPFTNTAGTAGEITVNGTRYLSNYGVNNLFFGSSSGNTTLTGTNNVGISTDALESLTSGSDNIALGVGSLSNDLAASRNIGIGTSALSGIVASNDNVAIGYHSQLVNISGSRNISIGSQSNSAGNSSDNIAIGYQASVASTGNNVAIGTMALMGNSTGGNNVAVGYQTLSSVTPNSASFNVAVGYQALNANTANDNVAVGAGSLAGNITGASNVAVGANALGTATGSFNIAIGNTALNDTTANNNIAIGYQSQLIGTSATRNISIGNASLASNITSSDNIAIGNNALLSTTAGTHIAIGSSALAANTSGTANIAIGYQSQNAGTTGASNVSIGYQTLLDNISGHSNTVLGVGALSDITTGSSNIVIGIASGTDYTGAESNNILLGNIGVIGDNETIRIGSTQTTFFASGIFGVTTTSATAIPVLVSATGQLGTVSSSKRYKQNIQDIGSQSSIIMHLRPVLFNYKSHPEVASWGLIAEEVEQVFPELVVYKDEEPETVKYHDLTVLLLNELQRLTQRVDQLEELIKAKGDV
jgi:trimeric autotransporter adhesin